MKNGKFLKNKRIWVAGHNGMVGSAILKQLTDDAHGSILLTVDRKNIDLRRQTCVEDWMRRSRPHIIFIAAAKVGGILANNTYPAQFIYDNLAIQTNIIEAARHLDVEKVLILGSSCIYPKLAAQPIQESSLLTGPLEPTNQWYAIAKISGIMLGQAYRQQYDMNIISAMPTNLYGPGDNYHPSNGHVMAGLIKRICEAKQNGNDTVTLWGTGTPFREFLHVKDMADACIFLMKHYNEPEPINIGTGREVSINDLADMIAREIGWVGNFEYDYTKPDGVRSKRLDTSKLEALGWKAKIELEDGIADAYKDFCYRYGVE